MPMGNLYKCLCEAHENLCLNMWLHVENIGNSRASGVRGQENHLVRVKKWWCSGLNHLFSPTHTRLETSCQEHLVSVARNTARNCTVAYLKLSSGVTLSDFETVSVYHRWLYSLLTIPSSWYTWYDTFCTNVYVTSPMTRTNVNVISGLQQH